MATRDLTEQFMRYRATFHGLAASGGIAGGAAGNASLMPGAESSVDTAQLQGASPAYIEMVNLINGEVNNIQIKMAELQRAHDKRLRLVLESGDSLEVEIKLLTEHVKKHFGNASKGLKVLQKYQTNASESQIRILQNAHRALAGRLHDMSRQFAASQKHYMSSLQQVHQSGSISSLLAAQNGASAPVDRDEGFTDEQVHQLAIADLDADQRMAEIVKVAQSVEELAEMFKELSTLVVNQGTILDRIDNNVDQAVVATKSAVTNLHKAEDTQKKTQKCMFLCMIILIVLICVCVAVIAFKIAAKS